jgi:predicted GNAT superfamily acetyltransferase
MSGLLSPPFDSELFETVLALNNAHGEELSYKTAGDLLALFEAASHVRAEAAGLALFVAFDDSCTYDNPNFAWFRARYPRFYYIDRVVVAAAARGRGLARRLYDNLELRARAEGRERLVCEINASPANPQSDSFHRALGFVPVGEQSLADRGKAVRYWAKDFSSGPAGA